LVRIAAGLLLAVLVLCGCWGEPPQPPRPLPTTPTTRLFPSSRPSFPPPTETPGGEVVGLCVKRRGQEVEFVRCLGRSDDAVVVGVTPVLIDTVGGPPFGWHCPPATDEVVPAQLPSGETTLLCLGTKPGNGNTRT
jgi:hypothetical protein